MRPEGTKASVLAHVPPGAGLAQGCPGRRGGSRWTWEVEGTGGKPPPSLTNSGSLTAVITLLIILRRRLRKQARAHGKSVPEIHEQLVTYDEEGGGEMDTTSYDVSVLNSARHGGAKPPRPALDRGRLFTLRCRSHPGKRPGRMHPGRWPP